MNAYAPPAYTILGVDARQTEMAAPLHLAPVGEKAVDLDFDGGLLSSEAGLRLLKAPAEPLGFTRALAAVLQDSREPRRGHFPWPDLLKQRVLQLAAGDEDANAANTLRHAPLCQLLLDRLPAPGPPWASPPTLSRCANHGSRTELSRMARGLVDQFLTSSARPPQRIVLDFADPEDPVHGAQAQARDDGSEGGYGFLPLHRYEGLSGRLRTTLCKAKRFTGTPRLAVLKRLGKRRRPAWPATLWIFRGDRPFASPEGRQWSAAQAHLSSGTGLTSQAVLQTLARAVVEQAKRAYERDGGTITRFPSTRAQAGTWSRSRRVVLKVAVSAQGVHTRCVVTDMEEARTKGLSPHIDWARGQAENESKDPKRSLTSDRTSCHRCEANQCRVFLQAAASGLLDTLRREVFKTAPWACATMETIQLDGLTLGARVPELPDRIKRALPSSCPVAPLGRRGLTLLACVRLVSKVLCVRSRARAAQGPSERGRPKRAETIALRPIASPRPRARRQDDLTTWFGECAEPGIQLF